MRNKVGARPGNTNRTGSRTATPRIRIDLSMSNGNQLRPALTAYMAANGIAGDMVEYARSETYRMWEERLSDYLPTEG